MFFLGNREHHLVVVDSLWDPTILMISHSRSMLHIEVLAELSALKQGLGSSIRQIFLEVGDLVWQVASQRLRKSWHKHVLLLFKKHYVVVHLSIWPLKQLALCSTQLWVIEGAWIFRLVWMEGRWKFERLICIIEKIFLVRFLSFSFDVVLHRSKSSIVIESKGALFIDSCRIWVSFQVFTRLTPHRWLLGDSARLTPPIGRLLRLLRLLRFLRFFKSTLDGLLQF